MVMSGLVDMPRVSHYRLAAHLSLALIVMAYLFWIVLDLINKEAGDKQPREPWPAIRNLALVTSTLVSVQIVYGAFTAGLRAGWGYNTFPTMNGEWLPDALSMLNPFWLNLFENNATVQFVHRWLGTLLLIVVAWLWSNALRKPLLQSQKTSLHLLLASVLVQYLLGVYVLLNIVPIAAASLHQAVGCLVLLAAVTVNFQFRVSSSETMVALKERTS